MSRPGSVPGRRASLGTALAVVLGDPVLWLLGAGGFLARGGFLVLALPIWTLPTPVELSTLLGPDAFGATGLGSRGVALAVTTGGLTLLVVFAALLASAAVDVAAWDRLRADPDWVEPTPVADARPGSLGRLVDVAGVALICLLPALGAVVVVTVAVAVATYAEVVAPGALEIPLALRIAIRAAPALGALAIALVVGELLYGQASRRVLRAADARDRARWPVLRSLLAVLRRPIRPLATAAFGWLVTAVALTPGLVSIAVCWSFVRETYRDSGPLGLDDAPALVVATVLLVAVWLAALLVAGFSSAVRAAAWSANAVREPAPPALRQRATEETATSRGAAARVD